jgi:hypothetical protein
MDLKQKLEEKFLQSQKPVESKTNNTKKEIKQKKVVLKRGARLGKKRETQDNNFRRLTIMLSKDNYNNLIKEVSKKGYTAREIINNALDKYFNN